MDIILHVDQDLIWVWDKTLLSRAWTTLPNSRTTKNAVTQPQKVSRTISISSKPETYAGGQKTGARSPSLTKNLPLFYPSSDAS
jgi:hypothetical protein